MMNIICSQVALKRFEGHLRFFKMELCEFFYIILILLIILHIKILWYQKINSLRDILYFILAHVHIKR